MFSIKLNRVQFNPDASAVEGTVTCIICSNLSIDPFYCAPCDTLVCSNCRSTNNCSSCAAPLKFNPKFVDHLFSQLPVKCFNYQECLTTKLFPELREHEEQCFNAYKYNVDDLSNDFTMNKFSETEFGNGKNTTHSKIIESFININAASEACNEKEENADKLQDLTMEFKSILDENESYERRFEKLEELCVHLIKEINEVKSTKSGLPLKSYEVQTSNAKKSSKSASGKKKVCQVCSQLVGAEEVFKCNNCGVAACSVCCSKCKGCDKAMCNKCSSCRGCKSTNYCQDCKASCTNCYSAINSFCPLCMSSCEICKNANCSNCTNYKCFECKKKVCTTCCWTCRKCKKIMCTETENVKCEGCKGFLCVNCVSECSVCKLKMCTSCETNCPACENNCCKLCLVKSSSHTFKEVCKSCV